MMASSPDVARAAMKAALASVEAALSYNRLASLEIIAAIGSIQVDDATAAYAHVESAIKSLNEGMLVAEKIGKYSKEAFG